MPPAAQDAGTDPDSYPGPTLRPTVEWFTEVTKEWKTIRPVPYPPPLVGVETGMNTRYVGPELLALLVRLEDGDETVPESLSVVVSWMSKFSPENIPEELEGLVDLDEEHPEEFLLSNGATRGDGRNEWTIPIKAILPFLSLTRVEWAYLSTEEGPWYGDPPSGGLDGATAAAYTAFRLGVPAEQAALYGTLHRDDKIFVLIGLRNRAKPATFIAWLESEGVYVTPETRHSVLNRGDDYVEVLLPVRLIGQANDRPEVQRIVSPFGIFGSLFQRYHWPQELVEPLLQWADWYMPEEERRYELAPTPTRDGPVVSAPTAAPER